MSHNETGLSAHIELTRLCSQRDQAIAKMKKALGLMAVGHQYATEAYALGKDASGGHTFTLLDRRNQDEYRRIFVGIDAERSLKTFQHETDASVWMRVIEETGIARLMDNQARKEFFAQLQSDQVPEVSEEAVSSAIELLLQDSKLIFQRGLANVFSSLDRRFKSHDAFKIGSRVILSRLFNEYGGICYSSEVRQQLLDVERVLSVLDKQDPESTDIIKAIDADRKGYGPRQSMTETRYLRIRGYKNGNGHLWFVRDDLIEKLNLMLADYYGAVLPDGVAKEDPIPKSGLPAKNLSFYATPEPVVTKLMKEIEHNVGWWGRNGQVESRRVLEPSAGTGNICRAFLQDPRYRVDAVEIEPGRVAELRLLRGLSVTHANFLQMAPNPVYDIVAMNPPFYGTHWMEHVLHAYEFLAERGHLFAVLPYTVVIGDSKKHRAFREWAVKHGAAYSRWDEMLWVIELPPESFASSGTRVQTCILHLHK